MQQQAGAQKHKHTDRGAAAAKLSCHSDRSSHEEVEVDSHEEGSQQDRSQAEGNNQDETHSEEVEEASAAEALSACSRHSRDSNAQEAEDSHEYPEEEAKEVVCSLVPGVAAADSHSRSEDPLMDSGSHLGREGNRAGEASNP